MDDGINMDDKTGTRVRKNNGSEKLLTTINNFDIAMEFDREKSVSLQMRHITTNSGYKNC